MAKKLWIFLAGILSANSSVAIPIGGGFTSGPDSTFFINMTFFNDTASTADVLSIVLDGSTATAFPILWDSVGAITNPAGAASVTSGVDTQIVTFNFFDFPNGFNPGESFSLTGMDPDGDPVPPAVTVGLMIGTQVTFNFEDGASLLYAFVDDPAANAGLVLERIGVAEPGNLMLLGLGLAGLGLGRRKGDTA